MTKDVDFVTIRIKKSDHEKLKPLVTYDTKIHDLITMAIESLSQPKGKASKH